jgi:hypothetical protein
LEADHLLIKGVKEIVAGSIGCVTGPRETCPSKGPLGNLSFFGSGEKRTPMFHFEDPLGSFPAHDLYRVLVSQIVAPFDRIKGVVFPTIFHRGRHVSKGGVDSSLSGNGVGPQGMNL